MSPRRFPICVGNNSLGSSLPLRPKDSRSRATRWFSDASVLTRYGIPTVNYGTSTGLMDVELGENLDIDGLVKTAETYALVAMNVCGVA